MNINKNFFKIKVQYNNFNIKDEYQNLLINSNYIGAVVTFCGLVRDLYSNPCKSSLPINSIYLECYYDMAKKVLESILQEVKNKFDIINATIIHRIGVLQAGEQIVFVGVSSKHRKEAFLACEYVIDFLKVKAPFWKKEITSTEGFWVKQKLSDQLKVSKE